MDSKKEKQATAWLGFLCLTRIAYFGINLVNPSFSAKGKPATTVVGFLILFETIKSPIL